MAHQLRTVLTQCVLVCLLAVVFSDDINKDVCAFPKHKSADLPPSVKKALGVLEKISGTRFIDRDEKNEYEYRIGICTKADEDAATNVGVVQVKVDGDHKRHRIGYFNDSHLIGGNDWISLEYRGGESYGSHCNFENKKAIIMIVCDPNDSEGHGKVIEENNIKTDECYYLFEYSHSAVCSEKSFQFIQGLSAGSVIIIIFICIMALYCIVGLLYQRFVRGAKGMEQIPNYAFWQDFGNLQADGCDLICRSGQRFSSRAYKGIGDDQLGDEEQDIDDHLLPM